MEEMALLIFSLTIQAAIGIIVFVAIAQLLNDKGTFKLPVVTAGGLAALGLLASLLHLGHPLRALNSLMHFATSWLSREIWFTALFAGFAIIAALLILFKHEAKQAIKAVITLAAVFGLIDVYMMASVYYSSSVPAWHYSATYVEFYTTTIAMGAVLFLLLGQNEAVGRAKLAVTLAGLAIGVQIAAMMAYYLELGSSSSLAAQQSLTIVGDMSLALTVRWILILAGIGMLLFSAKGSTDAVSLGNTAVSEAAAAAEKPLATSALSLPLAAGALLIGLVIGRYMFYAVMIISRVGLN